MTLVANGEIYNFVELRSRLEALGYQFATGSDCETIIHAYAEYGDDCLQYLHGMFAFALWDARRQRMLLARDRLGIKPLYLTRHRDGWVFASETKALLAMLDSSPQVNSDALAVFMQGQFGLGGDSLLQGVDCLLPGEAASVETTDRGIDLRRWSYWSLLDCQRQAQSHAAAHSRFDALMDEVMSAHLRTDVPYGLFLSGGLDSAILLALTSRLSETPVRTFSVAFAEDAGRHELELAPQLAQRFNARHTTFRVSAADLRGRVADTVWAGDHPNCDLANLPTSLLAQAASREVKVVLTGEGADEAFAGYERYGKSRLQYWLKNRRLPGSGGFRVNGRLPADTLDTLYTTRLRTADPVWQRRVAQLWARCPQHWSHLQKMQYVDFAGEIQDSFLVKVDRMLMSHGVEGRVPFLDHRVAAFGLSLPDGFKRRRGSGKHFLRQWAAPMLGRDVAFAGKRGFRVPVVDALFSASFLKRLGPVLAADQAVAEYFRPAGVAALAGRAQYNRNAGKALWSILVFALWHRMIVTGDGARPSGDIDPLEILA